MDLKGPISKQKARPLCYTLIVRACIKTEQYAVKLLLQSHKPIKQSMAHSPQFASTNLVQDWEELREGLTNALGMVRPTATGIGALLIAVFGYFFAFQDMRFYSVGSDSMAPTFMPGDCILSVAASVYQRGDIIVFNDPVTPGAYLTKRVVGVGGDTLTIERGTLHVNGEPVPEPYLAENMNYAMWPFRVPVGDVFVLGDNRNASDDSYTWWRSVPLREVRGRVVQVYLPFDRFQRVTGGTHSFSALQAGP